MVLTSEEFKFCNPGVLMIVGKFHRPDGLILLFLREIFMAERHRSIRQCTVTKIEVGGERPAIKGLCCTNLAPNIPKLSVEFYADIRVVQHAFEHSRIAIRGHTLKLICEIAVVTVSADG